MFDPGALTSGLVTGLREGVEAALVVSIVLAYLARTGNRQHFPLILAGTAAAMVTSLALGLVVFVSIGELPSPYEQLFEAATLLVAAGVVTWMLFWMRRQAASVKGELQQAVDRALGSGRAWGLAALAFTAVIREGLEAAVFLVGQATAAASSGGAVSVLLGAVVGLVLATALGVGFYHGSRRVNLAHFFRWTGIALVFIAAGLLSRALHELIEIGAVQVGTGIAFDIHRLLPDDAGAGQFLRALLGYSATPEWFTLLLWAVYVAVVLTLYLRPVKPTRLAQAAPAAPAS